MKKKLSLILAIVLAGFLAVKLNDPWRHIDPSVLYSALISTDGAIIPGTRQDFLINIFKNANGQRTFESKTNLGLRLDFPLADGTRKKVTIPLVTAFPGKYTCSCQIPEETDYSEVTATLFPDSRTDKPIMSCKIPVKRERAIVVRPPHQAVYAGDKINFDFASIDKKSGLSMMKIPVRIKLISPSGLTTLNRVVSTDTEGLGTFETRIHRSSPEGYYTFIFQSANFEQKISVYVKQAESKKTPTDLADIPIYMPEQESNETSGFIYNLNCQSQDALLAYGCPDSEHRQIEIWQNGKLHYFANLDLEGGKISLLLQKPLLAGCPALFKIWQISENQVVSHEKIRYIEPRHKNRFNKFLTDLNADFQNTERDKLALALARQGFIGVSHKFTSENLTLIQKQNLRSVYPFSKKEIGLSYYQDLMTEKKDLASFQIIQTNKALPSTAQCYVYLDSESFLNGYLNWLQKKESSLNRLLQEGICRVYLHSYLDFPSKSENIKELEGILIPLSEVYSYITNFPDKKKVFAPSILSVVNMIKEVVFVPAEFLFDLSTGNHNPTDVPMLEIAPVNCSFHSIQGLLKEAGTIQMSNETSTQTIKLDQPIIRLPPGYSQLTNTRNFPLVISY